MTPEEASGLSAADACLVLMLKAPARSKRRLADRLGQPAREAAERLWACAYEDALAWPGSVCFAPASEADATWLGERVPGEPLVIVQAPGNLGERLNYVNVTLAARGVQTQIFIGTDCPQLDLAYLRRAADLLDRHDAVLGPARDGGVVLMGARRPWPELSDLPWSSPLLRTALERRLAEAGWTEAKLGTLIDVDSPDDLTAVSGALDADTRPARREFSRWLRRHESRLTVRR